MPYTVASLLELAGRRRTRVSSHLLGYHMDHAVELQMAVAALNQMLLFEYTRVGWATQLVDLLHGPGNMQLVTAQVNLAKGTAVTKWLAGQAINAADLIYINIARFAWRSLRDATVLKVNDFVRFVNFMNAIVNSPASLILPNGEVVSESNFAHSDIMMT